MADTSFHTSASDEIDAEIREVFVDEVQEEFENLSRNLPLWQQDPNDFARLKPIRRSFHTLKGSGRLVGALALGDFSWKVENMLNRVLDKTIPPNAAAQTLVGQAIAVLPELLAGLRGEGAPKSDIGAIMMVADRLAAGEEAWVRSAAPVRMKKVRRVVRRFVPVVDDTPEMPAPMAEAPAHPQEMPVIAESTQSEDLTAALFESEDQAPARAATSSPLPHIDPLLYDIFTSEVAAHLGVMDGFVAAAQAAHEPLPASEPLLRAVHTLNGAVAMVDVPVITQVLAPLENYIKRLCAGHLAPTPDGLMALSEASELIRRVLAALDSGETRLPSADDLAQRIGLLRDELPEPQLMHTLFSRGEVAQPAAEAAVESAAAETTALETVPDEPGIVLESEIPAAPVEATHAAEADAEAASRTQWLDDVLPAAADTVAADASEHATPVFDELQAPADEVESAETAVLAADELAMAPTADDVSPAECRDRHSGRKAT
jgi:chemosensory pili system protein ChpA (sensor histidine kinase/response regulator)